MLAKVREFIAEHNLLSRGDLVIVAVSGGPDSVALLHVLERLSSEMGFSLHVAHLNHGLRAEAGEEEEFVARLAEQLGLNYSGSHADVRELARSRKMSLEEAGREARYAFFYRLQQELGATRVATAHHMGDQAETILMRLLRGTGLRGLRGIMPSRDIFIRPLLACTREEILAYLRDNRLEYRTDPSNYDPLYLRNRIRHLLLPQLSREYNPNIVAHLARLAEIAREENSLLDELTERAWNRVARVGPPGEIAFLLDEFKDQPKAVRRRLILYALAQLQEAPGWEMKDTEMVLALAQKEGSGKDLHLSRTLRVRKSYQELLFYQPQRKTVEPFCYFLQIPGKTYIREMGIELTCRIQEGRPDRRSPGQVVLDWHKLKKPLEVRSRRPGDRFRPLGLGGSKKLKDFFIDAKVPLEERDRIGLLASGDEIYWVIGYRLDEKAVVDSDTSKVLVLEVKPRRA